MQAAHFDCPVCSEVAKIVMARTMQILSLQNTTIFPDHIPAPISALVRTVL
jgi:hypothetical protein